MRIRVTTVGNDWKERPKGVVEERDVVADERGVVADEGTTEGSSRGTRR